MRSLRDPFHGVLLIITDTVEEKPWLNFDTPAPIHTMTMKIFAATTMSTHDGKNANANMVGTYCSRGRQENTLSRNPITQMSTAYTTNGQRGTSRSPFRQSRNLLTRKEQHHHKPEHDELVKAGVPWGGGCPSSTEHDLGTAGFSACRSATSRGSGRSVGRSGTPSGRMLRRARDLHQDRPNHQLLVEDGLIPPARCR